MKKTTISLYIAALLIRIIFAIPFIHDWDGYVFVNTAKNLLNGQTPYQTVIKNSPTIYPDSDRPLTEQWYAYPPLPALMFTTPVAAAKIAHIKLSDELISFLIKIPFILGDLVAARLVYLYLARNGSKKAELAEKIILFNPLLIWISAAWGMFDIWIANFFLLSLLFLKAKRNVESGVAFALSLCIKLFPVFFLPLFIKLIVSNVSNKKDRIKILAASFITLAFINVPFFLTSPQGFMTQNLLMHLIRPPQGLSIVGLLDTYGYIYNFSAQYIESLISILMLGVLSVIYAYGFIQKKLTIQKYVFLSIVTYLSVLMFNKVTNEQYFVVLVVLLLTYIFGNAEKKISTGNLTLIEIAATFGALISSFFLGFHFLSFIMPNLSSGYFNASTNQLVFELSSYFHLPLYSYPESIFTFYNLPVLISTIVLIPFYILSAIFMIKTIPNFLKEIISKIRKVNFSKDLLPKSKTALIIAAVILMTASISLPVISFANNKYSLLKPVLLLPKNEMVALPKNPKVGTFYNVWWNNFSHNPNYAYDSWDLTTLTPSDGYYTSKNSYFVEHIKEMKSAGIDFAIVSYHLYDRNRYITFSNYAIQMGLYYAPLVEMGDALNFDKFRPTSNEGKKFLGFELNDESKKQTENVIISSLADTSKNPAQMKINNKPVVFLYDSHWFFPSWDSESKKKLSQEVIKLYSDNQASALKLISKKWRVKINSVEDVEKYYPGDILGFNDGSNSSNDFRTAFVNEYEAYWKDIRTSVEKKVGPVYLVTSYAPDRPTWKEFAIHAEDTNSQNVFDDEYFYSPSNTWSKYRFADYNTKISAWTSQVKDQASRVKQNDKPLFVPVIAAYNDTKIRKSLGFTMSPATNGQSLYNTTWKIAQDNKTDYILVTSWNEFFEGTAIEPTKEYGTNFLLKTQKLSADFKAPTCFTTVKNGQTIWSIAKTNFGDGKEYEKIIDENQITQPNLIHPGDKITIPCENTRVSKQIPKSSPLTLKN